MILDRILSAKREEIHARARQLPLVELHQQALDRPPPRDFLGSLHRREFGVIAELKRRSPAKGLLKASLNPGLIARTYELGGAAAMSVLTDAKFFDGSDADLQQARAACSLPVLRKDFVIDPYQIWEARALGADAVLLIVRALEDGLFRELHSLALSLNLAALVEVHDEPELERATAAGVSLIGVNNRDLDTLTTDITTAERLAPLVPSNATFVAESGVSHRAAAERMQRAGARGILVGEALMLAEDPAGLLHELSLQSVAAQP
ncbi:MAG TPA: indole-3-glycerol phosphate synthase TrpC [Chloroflexota bacterium]|nr:indole-3-glycerol phosphate synthase TrpC [Chloroflexota bacterium]